MIDLLIEAIARVTKIVMDAIAGDKKAQKRLKDILSDQSPSEVQMKIEQAKADALWGPKK